MRLFLIFYGPAKGLVSNLLRTSYYELRTLRSLFIGPSSHRAQGWMKNADRQALTVHWAHARAYQGRISTLYRQRPYVVTSLLRSFGPRVFRKNSEFTSTERFISKPIAQPLSIARPSARRTGIVDGNSPNQISNASAACSISMPRPSAHATAPFDDAQWRKGVGSAL